VLAIALHAKAKRTGFFMYFSYSVGTGGSGSPPALRRLGKLPREIHDLDRLGGRVLVRGAAKAGLLCLRIDRGHLREMSDFDSHPCHSWTNP
jgi:hypothetical protein